MFLTTGLWLAFVLEPDLQIYIIELSDPDSLRFRASTRNRQNDTNTLEMLIVHALLRMIKPRCRWLLVFACVCYQSEWIYLFFFDVLMFIRCFIESGPANTIPDCFSYRINFHSDGNIRGCLHNTASLLSELVLARWCDGNATNTVKTKSFIQVVAKKTCCL